MKKEILIGIFVLVGTALASGCISEKEYVCPDGKIVSDPKYCQTPTATPKLTAQLGVSPSAIYLSPGNELDNPMQNLTLTNVGERKVRFLYDLRPDKYKYHSPSDPFQIFVWDQTGAQMVFNREYSLYAGESFKIYVQASTLHITYGKGTEKGRYSAEIIISDIESDYSLSVPIIIDLMPTLSSK